MKRTLIIFSVVLTFILGGLLVAPSFMDWNKYKVQATDQVKKFTGYDVDIAGDISMALLPFPHMFIEGVSVRAPDGEKIPLLSLKRLEVSVALLPLLSGDVEVSSVNMVSPEISLAVDKAGQPSWMTPEIQALLNKPKEESEGGRNLTQAISLEKLSIEKGAFRYADARSGKVTQLSDLILDVQAKTLQGPFVLDGKMEFSGQPVSFEVTTQKMDAEAGTVSLNAKGNIEGIDAKFSGVIGFKEPFDVQGELAVGVESLAAVSKKYNFEMVPLKKDRFEMKGLVTASAQRISTKNLTLNIGGYDFSGKFDVALSPLVAKGDFQSAASIHLDEFFPENSKKKDAASKNLTELLPQTLSLPVPFEAEVGFFAPGLLYRKQAYGDVRAAFSKRGRQFDFAASIGALPGKGDASLSSVLVYSEKSVSEKTGAETYSNPALTLTVKGKTQNVPSTIKALSGLSSVPYLDSVKTGKVEARFKLDEKGLQVMPASIVTLDDRPIEFSGGLSKQNSGRDLLKIRANAANLNFADIQGAAGNKPEKTAGGNGNLEKTLEAFTLPYDVDFDVSVQNLVYEGEAVKGARALGRYRANTVYFEDLSVRDFAGATLKLDGRVGNIQNLSDMDLTFLGTAENPRKVAEFMKVDTAQWPKQLGGLKASVKLKGPVQNLDMTANVEAMNGQLVAQGNLKDPLGSPSVNNLVLQVKHRNMAEAMTLFAPTAPRYASLEKPLDFYTKINESGGVYTLEGLKADLAGTSMTGSITFDKGAQRPKLSGSLQLGNLVLKSAKNMKASSGPSGAASGAQGARWSSAPIDTAWMHSFDVNLDVVAKSIVYESWNLDNPVLRVNLDKGTLTIQELKAGLYGGRVDFAATIASHSQTKGPLDLNMKAKVSDVSLEALVKSLAGNPIIKGRGQINLDAVLKSSGASAAGIVNNLGGGGTLSGQDLVLEGFDLTRFAAALSSETKPGDTVLGLWKGATSGGSTAFDTLGGSYTVQSGIVNIDKADLDGPKAFMATKGSINLPSWTLKTTHSVTLKEKPDVPPFTINISGPLDNPGQTFGQGALNDYLSRKINRKLEDLLTKKLGLPSASPEPQKTAPASGEPAGQTAEPPDREAPQPPPQLKSLKDITPEDALRGLLDGLLQ